REGDLMLTVPVFNKDHFSLKVKNVQIRNDSPWKRKHFKSISIAYAKAPFASRYLAFFDDLYAQNWENLSDLNESILKFILKDMGISTPFYKLSDMAFTTTKSQLVLDMCLKMKADLYIFGALGKDYADQDAFQRAGVQLEFQDYHHPTYTQLH